MSLSARALSLVANTPCPRLDTLARAGVADTTAAQTWGFTTKSPRLAYALGKAYENRVTADTTALHELCGSASVGNVLVVDDNLADSGTWENTAAALADPAVSMILQGAVPGLMGGWLRPDILVRNTHGAWQVGEIKIYLDKGGATDPQSVSAALTQAATAAYSLMLNTAVNVDTNVHLLLTNLLGAPVSYLCDISGELARLRAASERVGYAGESTSVPDVSGTDHIYSARCIGACALADYCRQLTEQETGAAFVSQAYSSSTGVSEGDLLAGAWAKWAQKFLPDSDEKG